MDAWDAEFESWPAQQKDEYYREFDREREEYWTNLTQTDTDKWRADESAWEAERAAAIKRCPHGCNNGCRKAYLLEQRRDCPFSVCNKIPI